MVSPFFLPAEFAVTTIRTARTFARSVTSTTELWHLVDAANNYALQRGRIYTDYWLADRDIMARSFRREAHGSLVHCLRHFGVEQAEYTARSIFRVGHWLGHVPRFYGRYLQREIFATEGGALTWAHLAQLSRLAAVGPPITLKPKLLPWFGDDEADNAPLMAAYRAHIASYHKLWGMMCNDIVAVAHHVVDARLRPLQLERVVNDRLGKRSRGRPRKREIDLNSPIRIPDIPL